MQERENILRILKSAQKALKKEDAFKLKNLSNQTVHTASITQDPDNIAVAVIIYALSKIIERGYHGHPNWDKEIIVNIENSIRAIRENDEYLIKKNIALIRTSIEKQSKEMKSYIKDVFRKASINKASKIYEHGISMEKTADILGISMYELASYAGQTSVSDVRLSRTSDVKARIKLAIEMFL